MCDSAYDRWITQGTDLTPGEFWLLDYLSDEQDNSLPALLDEGSTVEGVADLVERGWLTQLDDDTYELTHEAWRLFGDLDQTMTVRRAPMLS